MTSQHAPTFTSAGGQDACEECPGQRSISTCHKTPGASGSGIPLGLTCPHLLRPLLGILGRGPAPPRGWAGAPEAGGKGRFSAMGGVPAAHSAVHAGRPRVPPSSGPSIVLLQLGRIKGDRAQPDTAAGAGTEAWQRGGAQRRALGILGRFCLNRLDTKRRRPHCTVCPETGRAPRSDLLGLEGDALRPLRRPEEPGR